MAQESLSAPRTPRFGRSRIDFASTLSLLRRETIAGMTLAVISLPPAVAAGLLVYGQLGHSFAAVGVLAGLYGAVFAGVVAALIAHSSFVTTLPAASVVIIPAALVASLKNLPPFAGHPELIFAAVAVCTLLAGAIQIVFGALNVGRIIKFTPHPVIAGFIDSVAILIILSQLRPFFRWGAAAGHWVAIQRPAMLAFVLVLSLTIIAVTQASKKIPGAVAGLIVGTAAYYGIRALAPDVNLGVTLGMVPVHFPPISPFVHLTDADTRAAILSIGPHLLFVSLTVAAVTTLQALLAFRVAQNLSDIPPWPRRDVIAQGAGNCVSALFGGVIAYPLPSVTTFGFRAGARTRIAPILCSLLLFLTAFLLSTWLAKIPVAVLSAILISISFYMFDRCSFRLLESLFHRRPNFEWRTTWQSLSIIVVVVFVSIADSIVLGAVAGFLLSCLIFMMDMSRPIVRRRIRGDITFSKRSRSADDLSILRRTGARRIALELQGVLFFGNADELSEVVERLLPDCDMILFDLRGIVDIDVSGVTILRGIVARCRARRKRVLFCNVPDTLSSAMFAGQASAVLSDFDSALEWMEEEALLTAGGARRRSEPIAPEAMDLMKAFDEHERDVFMSSLQGRKFPAGAVMCEEGEDADRMWILTAGTVSVRVRGPGQGDPSRVSNVGAGMTVGEMSLLDGGLRSATVVCDEDVESYELTRAGFDQLVERHPPLARKLFNYFTRQLIQRVRLLTLDLRAANR
jgi:sulfate permease, SulP family